MELTHLGFQNVTQKFRVGCCNASDTPDAYMGDLNPVLRSRLERTFNKYCSQPFYGTVHAEATLMGLVSYLSGSNDVRVNYGQPLPTHELQLLEQVIDPVSLYVVK